VFPSSIFHSDGANLYALKPPKDVEKYLTGGPQLSRAAAYNITNAVRLFFLFSSPAVCRFHSSMLLFCFVES
jgi:hypothetical protein